MTIKSLCVKDLTYWKTTNFIAKEFIAGRIISYVKSTNVFHSWEPGDLGYFRTRVEDIIRSNDGFDVKSERIGD